MFCEIKTSNFLAIFFVSKNGLNMRHLAEITPFELVADLGTRVPKFEKFRFRAVNGEIMTTSHCLSGAKAS